MDSQDMSFQDMDSEDMSSENQDMYFTNLLSGNSIVSLDDSPPLLHDSPTNVRRSSRGMNFSVEEDKLIVSSWLNSSLDAIQGTDQKKNQFWEQIFEYFHKHKETTTERTLKSLRNRWTSIQKATNIFCSYLAQVEGLNQSGMTEQNKFEKAKTMYQSLQKCNFLFEHCWQLLKDKPKWHARPKSNVLKPQKKSVPSSPPDLTPSPTENDIENEVIDLDRPMGRKAEKAKRKAQGMQAEEIIQLRKRKYTLLEESRDQEKEFYRLKAEKMEHDKTKEVERLKLEDEKLRIEAEKMEHDKTKEDERLKLEAERLRIEAEKTDLAKKEADQRIMMMDVNVLPEMQRQYFQELQREIMMRHNHA